jgi:2-keto-3-deoxy-L-fuconate dehydrogenase
MRLKNKTAFITAAGQGIGRAIAEHYIREGATVIATDLDASKLSGLKATCFSLNVLDNDAVKEAASKYPADILVNAAGFVHAGNVLDCTESEWDFAFNLNVKSMHRTIQAFVPAMLTRGGGSIINIASVVSSIKAAPNRYVYAASKAACIGLTKAVAVDFIMKNVRCNAICPGTVQSPSLNERIEALAAKNNQTLEAARKAFIDRQPLGRLGSVEEIAHLAVYLGSDESAFTTGQAHVVDGGFSL